MVRFTILDPHIKSQGNESRFLFNIQTTCYKHLINVVKIINIIYITPQHTYKVIFQLYFYYFLIQERLSMFVTLYTILHAKMVLY